MAGPPAQMSLAPGETYLGLHISRVPTEPPCVLSGCLQDSLQECQLGQAGLVFGNTETSETGVGHLLWLDLGGCCRMGLSLPEWRCRPSPNLLALAVGPHLVTTLLAPEADICPASSHNR